MSRARPLLLAASVVLVAAALAFGCIGSVGLGGGQEPPATPTTSTSPDASDGAIVTDVDAGSVDAASTTDAARPNCDPAKPFGAPVPVTEVNTVDQDLVSDLSPDGKTIYVATNHTDAGVRQFYAVRATTADPFGALQPVFPIVGVFDDWSLTITSDGLTVVVSSDRSGQSDLYLATRASTLVTFGTLSLASTVNSAGNDEGPRWTADGRTLYFDSTRDGARSIWRSTLVGATFGAPEKVTELASDTLDAAPVLSPDELTIYFASKRPPTPDGDIYVATRTSNSLPFENVHALANVNTPALDVPGHISADGCTLYLSSAQTSSPGPYDVFVARRPN